MSIERESNIVKDLNPNLEHYEFIGKIDFLSPEEGLRRLNKWEEETSKALETQMKVNSKFDEEHDTSKDDEDNDLGILVSADGRVFKEKSHKNRLTKPPKSDTLISKIKGSKEQIKNKNVVSEDEASQGNVNFAEKSVQDTNDGSSLHEKSSDHPLKAIVGSDNRTLITSAAYPWRAVGVALINPNSNTIRGSGAMVGPRHVLTAAHVITDDGNASSLSPVRAAPAARGEGYSGNRWPFDRRFVQWYYWPNGWDGGNLSTDARYDYAVLILSDINWSPGWVGFGYQTTTWLDYSNFNTAGYPGNNYGCVDSPLSSGECGGYMYRQFAQVRSVFPGHFYHRFDTHRGQSGSPIYWSNGNTSRVIYGVHSRSGGGYNIAHRIRSGSFNSICNWIEANPSSHFTNVSC